MAECSDDKNVLRVRRLIARAETKRATVISKIHSIHRLALRVNNEPNVIDEFQIAVIALDNLWSQFETADDDVLDGLLQLNAEREYSSDMPAEVLAIINATKAIAVRISAAAPSNRSQHISSDHNSVNDTPIKHSSRLLEIPLPSFKGDFNYWLTFRDRFAALVNDRTDISKSDKMHYLVGCLQGPALDAIRSIPVCMVYAIIAFSSPTFGRDGVDR